MERDVTMIYNKYIVIAKNGRKEKEEGQKRERLKEKLKILDRNKHRIMEENGKSKEEWKSDGWKGWKH